MMKNHKLAKSIQSVSWGEFVRQIQYKCEYNGKNFIKIGRFEPTSKLCNVCNSKHESLSLKDRDWTCMNCGTYHDRDINAAINIKNIGLNSGKAIPGVDVEMSPIGESTKRQDVTILSGTDSRKSNIPVSFSAE
jgi:putative transposase